MKKLHASVRHCIPESLGAKCFGVVDVFDGNITTFIKDTVGVGGGR